MTPAATMPSHSALRRLCLLLFIALLVSAGGAARAGAAPVTLGFDDQAAGTAVTNQYTSRGVEFGKFTGGPTGDAFVTSAPSPASLASTAPNVLDVGQCTGLGGEFPQCSADGYLHFDVLQSSVSLRLGFDDSSAPSASVTVQADDVSGHVVATATPTLSSGVHQLVTLAQSGSGAPTIAFLHFAQSEVGSAREQLALDDLGYDDGSAAGGGAPPPASPSIGMATSGEAILYTGKAAATATEVIKIGRFGGSTGPVSLGVSGLPSGVTAAFAQNPFTGGDGAGDVLTLTAAAGTHGGPLVNPVVTATPSASAGTEPVKASFPLHLLNSYSATTLGMSLAQAAGDRPQTGPAGASLAYDGVPLVAGRATLVRVFARPVGLLFGQTSKLTVTLSGSVNGQPLPGSPLTADAGGPLSLSDEAFGAQLGAPDTTFNFVLPPSWTTRAAITLTAHATGPGNLINVQPDPTPNETVVCSNCAQDPPSLTLTDVAFTPVPKFVVTPVQMTWRLGIPGTVQSPGDPQAALVYAYETAPVAAVKALGYQDTLDITPLQFDDGGVGGDQADADAQNMLVQWAQNRFQNDGDKNRFGSMVMGFNLRLARGMSNSRVLLGSDHNGNAIYEPVSTVAVNREISSVAHEMGHNLGRLHADQTCGGPKGGGSDPRWPDTDGHLEPTIDEADGLVSKSQKSAVVDSYGVDLTHRVDGGHGPGDPFVIYPSSAYDLMSYCAGAHDNGNPPQFGSPGNDWTSARGWQQEFACVRAILTLACPPNQFSEGGPAASASEARARPATTGGATAGGAGTPLHGPTLSFLGYVEPGGTLLSPALMPADGGVVGARTSAYSAQLVDTSGHPISTEPLGTSPTHLDAGPGHPGVALLALQGFLPTHGRAVGGLVLRSSGHLVGRIRAPRHVPRVRVRHPTLRAGARMLALRWRTVDRDRGRRTAFVAVRGGSGRFTTVWMGADRGQATLPITALRGRRVVVRVTVSDGFHTGAGRVTVTVPARIRTHAARGAAPAVPAWERQLARAGIRVVR